MGRRIRQRIYQTKSGGGSALPEIYDKLFTASQRYILVAEYYNPSPVEIIYRGHSNRLFKRDFAGELMAPPISSIDRLWLRLSPRSEMEAR